MKFSEKKQNRTDRLMAIVTLLQSRKNQTMQQLAAHFGISERTVFRDLKTMSEIGIPVHYEPEIGYNVAPGYFLPPVSLSLDEANALALSAPLVLRFADKSVHRHYTSAVHKIKMVLGRAQREQVDQLLEKTAHFVPDAYAHLMPDTEYLSPLQHAIAQRQLVRMQYENISGESSMREVEPIGLTFYSLNWHLIAWCHLRQDYRDFRISRIRQLQVTMLPFRKQDHISLTEYLNQIQEILKENPGHQLP